MTADSGDLAARSTVEALARWHDAALAEVERAARELAAELGLTGPRADAAAAQTIARFEKLLDGMGAAELAELCGLPLQ